MGIEQFLTEKQKEYMNLDAVNKEREIIHASWFDESTVDYWRHKRMYETIEPLAAFYLDDRWLTIGDGRFGLDSIRLEKLFGIRNILPTDIAENMLKAANEKGMLRNYGVENAEHLSFDDNSYDVVFCKESFHHFPRPYLALYEMIRVCRRAVILIEPADRVEFEGVKSRDYIISAIKLIWNKIKGNIFLPYVPEISRVKHSYEEAGNYLYSVSLREMEKLVHGLDLGGIAWFGFNDIYIKGCEFEAAINGNLVFEKIRSLIRKGDDACRRHPKYHHYNMVSVVIFKEKPEAELMEKMTNRGFEFPLKVANPFSLAGRITRV